MIIMKIDCEQKYLRVLMRNNDMWHDDDGHAIDCQQKYLRTMMKIVNKT